MAKIKSVKVNFFMNFILTATNFIFPLITFPYVSRVLLADGMGKVAFATSITSYFMMVAALGIPIYGIRACARVRDDKDELTKTTHELLIIHTITTTVAFVLFLISIFTIEKLHHEKVLMLINSISIILNLFGVNWLYQALEQYSYITIRSVVFKIISIILMFTLVHDINDYVVYGTITIVAAAGSNILNFLNLRKFIYLNKKYSYNIHQHIRPILVFFAQSVAIMVYTNLDTVMLGFMSSNEQVGFYNASIKVKTILLSLVTSLGSVLLPRLSYYVQNNMEKEFKHLLIKSLKFVVLLSLPLVVYFVVYAKECIVFLSGSTFINATLSMQIIIPTVFFIGLTGITGMQILTPLGKEKYVVVSVIIGAVVDLIANIIFIPKLGAAGASLGTLLAEISVFIAQVYFLRDFLKDLLQDFKILKIVFSLIVSFLVTILINSIIDVSIFFELLITSILFFSIYLLSLVAVKEELVYEYCSVIVSKILKK